MGLARHILRSTKYGALDYREATIAKHVPYLRHVAEDMLKTKDGHHLMVIKIGGYCFQTADQAEIDVHDQLDWVLPSRPITNCNPRIAASSATEVVPGNWTGG